MVLSASAEALGTFLLVLVGTSVASAAVIGKSTAGPAYDSLAIALSFGLILVAIVAAIGQVSGAHVNPAVTVGPAATGKFPWKYVPAYLVAQLVGAIVAAVTVWGGFGARAKAVAHLGAPAPVGHSSCWQVFLVAALIAFILVFVVMAVATDPRVPAGSAALTIGFALASGVLLGGPVSSGAGNPARALGPDIITGRYPVVAAYVIGPLVGGVVAAFLNQLLGKANVPESAVADTSTKPGDPGPNERGPDLAGPGGPRSKTQPARTGPGR